jgi:hypothetical protein
MNEFVFVEKTKVENLLGSLRAQLNTVQGTVKDLEFKKYLYNQKNTEEDRAAFENDIIVQQKWVTDVENEAAGIRTQMKALMKTDAAAGVDYLPADKVAENGQLQTWLTGVENYKAELQRDLTAVKNLKAA